MSLLNCSYWLSLESMNCIEPPILSSYHVTANMTCSSWPRQVFRLDWGMVILSEVAVVFLLDWENVIGLIVYSTKKQTGSWEPGYQEQLELWCEHINLNSFGLEGLVCKLWQMMNTKSRCASPYLYIRIQDGQIRRDILIICIMKYKSSAENKFCQRTVLWSGYSQTASSL